MATLVCSSFVFMSCDDDDDKFTPESIVTKAFDTKYPDAQRVSWENEAGYVKAEFYTGSYEAEAWFDPQGNWMLTETDLPYKALPQTVKNSFEASLYAKWKIDDVDMLERPDAGTIYVLDVENGDFFSLGNSICGEIFVGRVPPALPSTFSLWRHNVPFA